MVAGQITTGAEPWNILDSDAQPLPSAVLAQRLQAVTSIYTAPAIPAEYSGLVGAEMFIVNVALQELNVRTSGTVASNSSLQQAMQAGAIYGMSAAITGPDISFSLLNTLSRIRASRNTTRRQLRVVFICG